MKEEGPFDKKNILCHNKALEEISQRAAGAYRRRSINLHFLRKLVSKGLAETKMDIAVDQYAKEKTSLEQSSAMAGVSIWRFLDELRKRNVVLKYSLADAQSEIEGLIRRRS